MDMNVANSWWMYMLGAVVVLFVLAGCIFFIIKAFQTFITSILITLHNFHQYIIFFYFSLRTFFN